MALLDKFLKTKRERVLFYATMSVVVGSILLTSLVMPVLENWSKVSTKLSLKKSELRKVNDLLKNENKINEEFNNIQKGTRIPDPQKRAEDTLLLQADEMQKNTGVRFTRMDPVYIRKIPKMPGYQSYTLQVVFEGDLLTVGKFLKEMQERGLYIDFFQLAPKTRAPHNPALIATIRMGKLVSKEVDKK